MDQGFTGIAMFKYCYVDIGETTDVRKMFNAYRGTIEEVRRSHPSVRIVHMTVPLTTVDSSPKDVAEKRFRQEHGTRRQHQAESFQSASARDLQQRADLRSGQGGIDSQRWVQIILQEQ